MASDPVGGAHTDLELSEGNLAEVEVDGGDLGVVDDVVEGIVARRRDGDDMVVTVEGEDGLLDTRVLPRHVVDVPVGERDRRRVMGRSGVLGGRAR